MRNSYMKALPQIVVLSLCIEPAFGHSGGTDATGCHAGIQPYHCHNRGSDSASVDVGAVLGVAAVFALGAVVWYYCLIRDDDHDHRFHELKLNSTSVPRVAIEPLPNASGISVGVLFEI